MPSELIPLHKIDRIICIRLSVSSTLLSNSNVTKYILIMCIIAFIVRIRIRIRILNLEEKFRTLKNAAISHKINSMNSKFGVLFISNNEKLASEVSHVHSHTLINTTCYAFLN